MDEAVTNLLAARMKLGLFEEEETIFDKIPYTVVDSGKMQELNLKAAENSIVLLKNENHLLPLDKSK